MTLNLICVSAILIFGPLSHANAANPQTPTCLPHQYWVQAHTRRAYIKSDGTPVSATQVSAHCKDKRPSYDHWETLVSNKKVTAKEWPHPRETQKKWSTEEKERLLDAISTLPKQLLLDSIKSILRFERSSEYSRNPGANREGVIVLYDTAFEANQNLARIFAHELAHEYFRQAPDDKIRSYLEAAEWIVLVSQKKKETRLVPGRMDYVEDDGAESPSEDFSNNVEYFLFEPAKLLKMNPKIHSWIKRTFDDSFNLGAENKK